MSKVVVEISNLNISFNNKIIFKDFNFIAYELSSNVLIGKSGKGKTTFLNALMGFTNSENSSIKIFGIDLNDKNIKYIRENIGFVPQEFPFNGTVIEFIKQPFLFAANKSNVFNLDAVFTMFDEFLLDKTIINKSFNEISGGEKQRLVLITVLLLNKPLLLLDEPVTALDDESKKRVINYIINKTQATVISVSHDDMWINSCQNKILI